MKPRSTENLPRPSFLALLTYFIMGVAVGLLGLIGQPPGAIILGMGLLLYACAITWRAPGGIAPPRAYRACVLGVGILSVFFTVFILPWTVRANA